MLQKTYPITPSFVLLLTQIKETFCFKIGVITFIVEGFIKLFLLFQMFKLENVKQCRLVSVLFIYTG